MTACGTPRRYAHSRPGTAMERWEFLSQHLQAVAALAARFAEPFGWSEAARVLGLLHDIGKASPEFQAYIAAQRSGAKGPDHSTGGARVAVETYGTGLGRILAWAIAGHHAGLGDAGELDRRLDASVTLIPRHAGWQAETGALPPHAALRPGTPPMPGAPHGFGQAFLTRMLFSCLVDADFLATEAFYAGAEARPAEHTALATLHARLQAHMAGVAANATGQVNALRAQVLAHALERATLPPGLFTLTVPTGGGKTLASLAFALEHALRHGLRRVIYVIPYTSIIEQTAAVFRTALSSETDILEHHASFDWPDETRGADEGGNDGLTKLRRAAENWDVPIVVTTAVQFFESLYAGRPSRCRRLHNLAGAVIVLDEAQTLPLPVLRPCMAALEELTRNYRASVVLCTATQPALREKDGFKGGFPIDEERELAPDPRALYARLKRVRVEVLPDPVPDATVAARFAETPQMLCIVNSRAHARAVFEAIRDLPGAVHLSTLMVPKHRRQVLAAVRQRLAAGEPVRIVSTSLIEAGVDIDLPEVWRAATGLDAIAQAAGRCNRNGLLPSGRVVVFEPADRKPPHAVKTLWQAAQPVLRKHEDVLGLDAIQAYFGMLYWQKGPEALDGLLIDGQRGVLPALAAGPASFPFRSLADAFRLIEETMEPVVIPWDEEGKKTLRAIGAAERPPRDLLRKLQQYVVAIPRAARGQWLAQGALRQVHPALGDALLAFDGTEHYRAETGLDLATPEQRAAESMVM